MPQVMYVFDLPDEQGDLKDFMDGPAYRSVLSSVWNKLRDQLKYHTDDLTEDEQKAYERFRSWISDECQEEGIEVPW